MPPNHNNPKNTRRSPSRLPPQITRTLLPHVINNNPLEPTLPGGRLGTRKKQSILTTQKPKVLTSQTKLKQGSLYKGNHRPDLPTSGTDPPEPLQHISVRGQTARPHPGRRRKVDAPPGGEN